MYKCRNITDFFRPSAPPRHPTKRPRQEEEEEDVGDSIVLARPCPKLHVPPSPEQHTLEDSPTSSALTSIGSDSSIDYPSAASKQTVGIQTAPTTTHTQSSGSQTSRGPVLLSSQRVTRHGQTVIRNSDDESDSDESLEDLDEILSIRKTARISSPPTEPDLPPVPSTTQSKPRSRRGRPSKNVTTPLPVAPNCKFSLDTLVAHAVYDDAAEAGAVEARHLVASLDQQRAALEAKVGNGQADGSVDTKLLATMVPHDGDNENIDRLMHAIERTEALQLQKSWSFFDSTRVMDIPQQKDFPIFRQGALWKEVAASSSSREEAFVNGFFAELAGKGLLADEILSWILDAVSKENNESLRSAYVTTLASAKGQLEPLLTSSRIDELFRDLGAREEAVRRDSPIILVQRTASKGDNTSHDWSKLRHVVELLSKTVSHMTSDARNHSMYVLFRLSLDSTIDADGNMSSVLETALTGIEGSIPEAEFEKDLPTMLSSVYGQIEDPQFRLQLLKAIPASTIRLNLIRRRLALSFFFQNPSFLSKSPPDLVNFPATIHRLRKPEFRIAATTDYTRLAAFISILDIGLDDGDPPTSPLDAQVEADFNSEVDRLAKVIKSIFTRIIDSGASHMTRTEAKDVLEMLQARLIYAVRTKPKPKKGIFGTASAGQKTTWGNGDSMGKFLKSKTTETTEEGKVASEIDEPRS